MLSSNLQFGIGKCGRMHMIAKPLFYVRSKRHGKVRILFSVKCHSLPYTVVFYNISRSLDIYIVDALKKLCPPVNIPFVFILSMKFITSYDLNFIPHIQALPFCFHNGLLWLVLCLLGTS